MNSFGVPSTVLWRTPRSETINYRNTNIMPSAPRGVGRSPQKHSWTRPSNLEHGDQVVVGRSISQRSGQLLLKLGMLTVTFFGCFLVCFSAVFTANSNIFAAKTDEKRNEKQMKNGYHEPLPPGILEKQQKNKINVSSAWQLLFNSAVSWVISTDSARLPCFVPCASRYTLCLANLLVNAGWMG